MQKKTEEVKNILAQALERAFGVDVSDEIEEDEIAALKCSDKFFIKERIKKVVKCVANAGSFPAYPIAVTDTVSRKLQVFNSEAEFEKNFNEI